MNKEELKNIENHRQDLIKENNTLTNLLEIERKQVGRLAEQLNLSGVMPTFVLFAEWLQYNGKWSLPEQQVKDFFKEQQEQN